MTTLFHITSGLRDRRGMAMPRRWSGVKLSLALFAAVLPIVIWKSTAFACSPLAYLSLSPNEGREGQSVTVSGYEFYTNNSSYPSVGRVDVKWNSSTLLWRGVPDQYGNFQFTFAVPAASPMYSYVVAYAYDHSGNMISSAGGGNPHAGFTIDPPPANPAPQPASNPQQNPIVQPQSQPVAQPQSVAQPQPVAQPEPVAQPGAPPSQEPRVPATTAPVYSAQPAPPMMAGHTRPPHSSEPQTAVPVTRGPRTAPSLPLAAVAVIGLGLLLAGWRSMWLRRRPLRSRPATPTTGVPSAWRAVVSETELEAAADGNGRAEPVDSDRQAITAGKS